MPTSLALRSVLPEKLAADVRRLGERYGIRNIRVFGSFARGEAEPESNLDLLVEYVPGRGGFAFVDFCDQVEELLGRKGQGSGPGRSPLMAERDERLYLADISGAIDRVLLG